MNNLKKTIVGEGLINIAVIQGWGFNADIWNQVVKKMFLDFKFHIIDLPGFGINAKVPFIKIKKLTKILMSIVPRNSVWLGWSIGSFVVNYISLFFPNDIYAIINVCASPCLIQKNNWSGLKIDTLKCFLKQLILNYKKTIYYFLKVHTLVTESSTKIYLLNNNIKKLISPFEPSIKTLKNYFNFIINTDLRMLLSKIKIPSLSLYGELDSLIPMNIIQTVNNLYYQNNFYLIKKSGHIPFLSHPKIFSRKILDFKKQILL